jgi:hypothetical protein
MPSTSLCTVCVHPRMRRPGSTTPGGMAPQILNLDHWAWHVIDALRQEAMRNPPTGSRHWLASSRSWSPSALDTWDRIIWGSRCPCGLPPPVASSSC